MPAIYTPAFDHPFHSDLYVSPEVPLSYFPQVQLIIFPVNCNIVIKLTQSRVSVFLSVFGTQTVVRQEIFLRCLAASYIRIPAAIAAFSDSTLPCIGILISLSASSAALSESPFASLPMRIAMPPVMLV